MLSLRAKTYQGMPLEKFKKFKTRMPLEKLKKKILKECSSDFQHPAGIKPMPPDSPWWNQTHVTRLFATHLDH